MVSMDTMLMIYNYCGHVVYVMKHNDPKTVKSEEEKTGPSNQTFFPRIIREFDDGPDEKPMIYGGGVD